MKYWKRKGLFYYANLELFSGFGMHLGTVTKRLDFVSFHVIKWIHGDRKLLDMALNSIFKDMFEEKK